MLTRNVLISALTGMAAIAATPSHAFDPDKVFAPDTEPQAILKYGFEAYKDGRKDDALGAFKFGAEKKHLPSQWKVARMYQLGDGIAKDDWVAFKIYQGIANRFVDSMPSARDKPYVASAVVQLGTYHLKGIEGTPVHSNASVAEDLYYRAAALYGNASAQYLLANLYLDARWGEPQPIKAARWLRHASKKGHAPSQAQLGTMLVEGAGIPRDTVRGLVLLTIAASNTAAGALLDRIREQQLEAFNRASEEHREAARKIVLGMNLPNPARK